MKLGAILPQIEIGNDTGAVRDFIQAVEAIGFDYVGVYDHVLGADRSVRPGWKGFYASEDPFREVFVLYGYAAGITSRIELSTCIVILPQRQTVLAAKQAAEIDLLSNERFRLGIGIGWNEVEYVGLGEDFHNRGARVVEQVELMRKLWAEDVVTFNGKWHTVEAAGILPRPRRQIPVWFGGTDERVLRRTVAIGDGWFPLEAGERGIELLRKLRSFAAEAGRDPSTIGVDVRIPMAGTDDAGRRGLVEAWRAEEVSHMSIVTMRAGHETVDDHIEAIRRFYEEYRHLQG